MSTLSGPIQPDEWITSIRAAYLFGYHPQTLRNWRNLNRWDLPYKRVGKQCYYRLADIQAALETGLKKPKTDN